MSVLVLLACLLEGLHLLASTCACIGCVCVLGRHESRVVMVVTLDDIECVGFIAS